MTRLEPRLKIVNLVMEKPDLQLRKDDIASIWIKQAHRYIDKAYVTFKTVSRDYQVRYDPMGFRGNGTYFFLQCMKEFAPDRFYNEETGTFVSDELCQEFADEWRKKHQEKQEKKHWW